jgi:hypothetical protein
MGTARQNRGKRTNVVVAKWLRFHGWLLAEPTVGAETGQDVKNVPGHSIEVKARANFDPLAWLKQAQKNAKPGQRACAVIRCNSQGEHAEDYLVIRRLEDDELNRTRFHCGEGCTGYDCTWCASTSEESLSGEQARMEVGRRREWPSDYRENH